MAFMDFFKTLFSAKKINVATHTEMDEIDMQAIRSISTFAIFTSIEFIANIVSKVEFKTYTENSEIKGLEWYNLNIKPNKNQSSTEFWREAVCNLLYSGELLIIPLASGQKIIATDFTKEEQAVSETTFHNIYRNDFRFRRTYKISDVYYMTFGGMKTTSVLSEIIQMLTCLVNEAMSKYAQSGGQKGILELPGASMSQLKDDETLKNMISSNWKSYYKAKNAIMPLAAGQKYTPQNSAASVKSTNEINDIKILFEQALTTAAQSYKIPPQLLLGGITGVDDALSLFLTTCIDPICNCISEELSGKQFSPEEYISGDSIRADTTHIKHVDIFSQANSIDKLIASGMASINEIREKVGMGLVEEEWADKHYLTKNYQEVEELLEGGENNV